MIEDQPPLGGFDRGGARADLGALPPLGRFHHQPVFSPVGQIGAFRTVDVAERGVPVVAGAVEQEVASVDLAREKYSVAVVGREGVGQLVEFLKIERPADADGRPVDAVAPDDVPAILHPDDAGIVALDQRAGLRVFRLESDRLRIDLPIDAVVAESPVELHVAAAVVHAEDTGEAVLVGDDRAVEDAVRRGGAVTPDDRIAGAAPDRVGAVQGTLFIRKIGDGGTENLHGKPLCLW